MSASHTSRPVPIAGSMSTPAQSPAPRTADDAVADELLEAVVQVRAERRGHAPANSPVASMRTTSRPTAAASGLPPNVEPCWPGCSTPSTSRSPTTAETGTMPPPSALPSRYRSGTTPTSSHANVEPTRPRPDWISSAMSSTLPLAGDLAERRQEVRRRHDDAGLALDRLDEHGDGVLVDGRGSTAAASPYGTDTEPGRVRPEVVVRVGVVAERR